MATRAEGAVGGSRRTVAAAALALAAVVLFPFLWLLLMSFKSEEDIFASPMTPFVPTLDNYVALWQGGFPRSFANSAIVSLSSTAVAMAVGVPAGYALSRLPRATSDWWSLLILASRMAPPIAFTIPFFLAYRHVGLLDTLAGLILVYLTFNLSLVIWMMRSYFEECPRSLEEAAWLDGASMLQTFTRVVLPLSTPGLAATAILCFIYSWNDFFFALILTRREAQTAPVAVVNFMNLEGWDWGRIAAGGTLVMLPVLVFSIVVRKFLVQGMTAGAVKG